MIFEKGIDDVLSVTRKVIKSNDYNECNFVIIPSFQSMDVDKNNNEICIVINSNINYTIRYKYGTAMNKISSLIKSEVRDGKINDILS